ncbi:MaoC family dehydratase [Mesorhizobium sp. BH1-1-4]|uniref:MaoC family dehydratase n=1 Tax=Mesorhizobium sp. BH1-1-4 TaxID=2876662 RepID=UPI001CD0D1CD|nr:MaoC/PaaZ C-terminal domain-containing protein [Mesorhizobium sp. BH1-1-4]MBZ9994274.1 MaoC family dehydratase N-terminal domain-containing protein [Mesorhizobium sp. BH1-1-4]
MTAAAGTGRKLTAKSLSYGVVAIGDWYETGAVTITEQMIDAFAELTGDRFEIHMSAAGAERHGFPARVAHGLLVLSLVDGLKNRAQAGLRAIASLGWDWTFVAPVLADDEIRVRVGIENKRETRNAARGILTLRFLVTNQRGETVQSGENKLMVCR